MLVLQTTLFRKIIAGTNHDHMIKPGIKVFTDCTLAYFVSIKILTKLVLYKFCL